VTIISVGVIPAMLWEGRRATQYSYGACATHGHYTILIAVSGFNETIKIFESGQSEHTHTNSVTDQTKT
jgi:hypothetical protein